MHKISCRMLTKIYVLWEKHKSIFNDTCVAIWTNPLPRIPTSSVSKKNLQCTIPSLHWCGLSARRAWRTLSSRPKGPKAGPKCRSLEVGARRAPRLLVKYIWNLLYCWQCKIYICIYTYHIWYIHTIKSLQIFKSKISKCESRLLSTSAIFYLSCSVIQWEWNEKIQRNRNFSQTKP